MSQDICKMLANNTECSSFCAQILEYRISQTVSKNFNRNETKQLIKLVELDLM